MQPAIGCKGPVAGDEPADGVGADGGADRPGGLRRRDRVSKGAVSAGLSGRNVEQRAPDLPPEGRAIEADGHGLARFKHA